MNSQPANITKLKSAYNAPQLLVYGGMVSLTAAGSMGMNEANCMNARCRARRRP